MKWINNNFQHFNVRETDYNSSVCMNKTNVNNIIDNFDGIFDGLINFTDEIASLQLYPFKVLPYENPEGKTILKTSRGNFRNVECYSIDYSAYYVTLGEYEVKPYFNNFADYKGYTQIKIFLPQLGFVDIDVNECMGKWLQFRLSIDFYSGKGMYIIGVSDTSITHRAYPYPQLAEDAEIRIISTFECDMGVDIPLGKSNMGDIKRNLLLGTIKTAAAVGFATYTGSLPPPTSTTSTVKEYNIMGRSKAKGSRLKPIKTGTETTTKTTVHHKPVDKSKPISEAVNGSIDVLNNLTIHSNTDRVNDSALMWSTTGEIKIVIYRPKFVELSTEYGKLYGYPLGETKYLSELSGYTEINSIHFEGGGFGSATHSELAALEEIFSDGVIL